MKNVTKGANRSELGFCFRKQISLLATWLKPTPDQKCLTTCIPSDTVTKLLSSKNFVLLRINSFFFAKISFAAVVCCFYCFVFFVFFVFFCNASHRKKFCCCGDDSCCLAIMFVWIAPISRCEIFQQKKTNSFWLSSLQLFMESL